MIIVLFSPKELDLQLQQITPGLAQPCSNLLSSIGLVIGVISNIIGTCSLQVFIVFLKLGQLLMGPTATYSLGEVGGGGGGQVFS